MLQKDVKNKKNNCNCYLTSRGYIIRKSYLTPKRETKLRKDLSVAPFEMQKYMTTYGPPPKKFPVFMENHAKYYVPRFWGITEYGSPEYDELKYSGKDIDIPFNGELRSHQEIIVNQFIPSLIEKGGGILNLACAQGKTVMALNIISKMKKKTLVVVHKKFLMDQWVERIKTFLPNTSIGYIQGSNIKVENCDIVISMLQSLSMRNYDNKIFSDFGMTIVDECHHTAAEVFSRAFSKISTQYMIGLSATLDRKDGLRKVFEWYLGSPVEIKLPKETIDTVGEVHSYMLKFSDPSYQIATYNVRGTLNLPKMINTIVESPNRLILISNIINKYHKEYHRKILVLSERRGHLLKIKQYVYEKYAIECGLYVGGEKAANLKNAETKKVILGTYHMISEGFDLASLNTLIYASPKTDVVQASGRILRQLPDDRKCIPTIIDIWDQCTNFEKKGDVRKRYYKKSGFKINITSDTEFIEND